MSKTKSLTNVVHLFGVCVTNRQVLIPCASQPFQPLDPSARRGDSQESPLLLGSCVGYARLPCVHSLVVLRRLVLHGPGSIEFFDHILLLCHASRHKSRLIMGGSRLL